MVDAAPPADEEQRAQVIAALRTFGARDSELGRQFARSHDMHPTDAAAVVEILTAEQRGDTLTPARLAAKIGLTTGATSTLLRRLESAGHIVRSHDHDDRRRVSLRSTDTVHETATAFYAPLASAMDAALKRFSAADLDTAAEVIAALEAAIDTTASRVSR
ncbi:MarR family winged helix-turn-helix transcriptional regulator [Curtobacterium sp. NPDC090217]|uniref:MarR family winged helix-turn-helix transcriptional regulator n=1 Tax=Curtobacterium sp. NPDC090217 TaxID=3363970 RepID=UPI00382593D2